MQKKYHYSLYDKIFFYISYFFYKLIIPLEVKKPRLRLWFYEIIYSLAKFKDYSISIRWPFSIDTIETKFGTFKIRTKTSDAANVSPAFERRDQNYLISLISSLTNSEKKVLFLDIGGDIGSYSILIANKFRQKHVDIKCFEPIQDSCLLIKENISKNNADSQVTVYPIALSNENNDTAVIEMNRATPGSSSMKMGSGNSAITKMTIATQKLDKILNKCLEDYDSIVCKIDVEGFEKNVLMGAQKVISSNKDIYIMVEDFVNPEIIEYLEQNQWSFIKKVTSYNSWWHYQN